jgi:2-polyprenyl-3-methyl-5-hydroxy-6-metoxy-1,4-benzoquinol methylase
MNLFDWQQDDEQNIKYYTERVSTYGHTFLSLDWGSRETQELRFSILSQVGQLNGARVLDVGCGFGDFYRWLMESGINVHYTGIDITPNMVEIAQTLFPETRIELKNLLNLEADKNDSFFFDFVFASGIFTHRQRNALDFFKEMITKMFSQCTTGLAFNSLSTWSSKKEVGEFYADPVETLKFCRTLTPWVVLRHDYLEHDFTIYLYRKAVHQ